MEFALCAECNLESGAITSIKFSPREYQIAVATSVGNLYIFTPESAEPSIEYPPCDGPINQVSWDVSASSVYAVTECGTLWFYELSTLSSKRVYTHNGKSGFLSCDISCHSFIAIGSTNGELTLLNLNNIMERKTVQGHSSDIYSVEFKKDGEELVSCSNDSLIRFWTQGLVCFASFSLMSPITGFNLLPSNKTIFACSYNKTFRLITNVGFVKKVLKIDRHSGYPTFCRSIYFGGQQYFVVSLDSGYILLIDSKVTEISLFFIAHNNGMCAMDVSPRSFYIATGGNANDMTFKLWKNPQGFFSHQEEPNQNMDIENMEYERDNDFNASGFSYEDNERINDDYQTGYDHKEMDHEDNNDYPNDVY